MENQEPRKYKVTATHRRKRVIFTVEATTGSKTVAEARRQAKAQGVKFMVVNSIEPAEGTTIRYAADYGAPLTALGGTYDPSATGAIYAGETPHAEDVTLSLEEINVRIRDVWERMVVFIPRPDEPPLKAYEQDGRVFLDDGVSGRQELFSGSPMELVMMLYDWATYVGYCSEDFDAFVGQCWT